MHLDIDAFFPSVEQSRMPFLRGKPVVVGSGVIASCSYEARRFGLHAGMAIHEARKRCPQAVYLAGDAQVYRSFAEKIWEQCHTMSPAVDTACAFFTWMIPLVRSKSDSSTHQISPGVSSLPEPPRLWRTTTTGFMSWHSIRHRHR